MSIRERFLQPGADDDREVSNLPQSVPVFIPSPIRARILHFRQAGQASSYPMACSLSSVQPGSHPYRHVDSAPAPLQVGPEGYISGAWTTSCSPTNQGIAIFWHILAASMNEAEVPSSYSTVAKCANLDVGRECRQRSAIARLYYI